MVRREGNGSEFSEVREVQKVMAHAAKIAVS